MKTINELKNELAIIDERIGQITTSTQRKIDALEKRANKIEKQILKLENKNEIHNQKLEK